MKICINGHIFEILIVKKGELLKKAQLLRGRVFFGKDSQDTDKFDKFCEHIVVIDTKTDKVVGTYRLLLSSRLGKDGRFYSETEFDLSNIRKNCKEELLEMGRACVDPSYRKFPIIRLMWKTIVSYVMQNRVGFIFGCASIDHPNPEKVGKIFTFLKHKAYSPPLLRVSPLGEKRFPYQKTLKTGSEKEALQFMPSLVKGYLAIGAFICGEPVWDKELNTADFFMMIDTRNMNTSFLRKFFYAKSR
jgi:putative hemolysin